MHRGGSASTCAHLHRFSPLEILVLREADVELEGHLLMSRECGRGLRVPPVARPASQGPLPPAARRRRCTSICTCYSAGAACMLPVPRCRPPPARFPGAMAEIPSAGKRKQSLRLEKLPSFRINTSLPPPSDILGTVSSHLQPAVDRSSLPWTAADQNASRPLAGSRHWPGGMWRQRGAGGEPRRRGPAAHPAVAAEASRGLRWSAAGMCRRLRRNPPRCVAVQAKPPGAQGVPQDDTPLRHIAAPLHPRPEERAGHE